MNITRYSGVTTYRVECLLDIVELLHKELMFTRYSGVIHIELMFTRYSGVNTYRVENVLDIVELLHIELMFTRYSGVNTYRVNVYQI